LYAKALDVAINYILNFESFKTFCIFVKIKNMDTTTTINDYLENPAYDFESLSDLISMAQDYQYQQLMSELQEEGL
jgi:hypothetical protein